MSGLVEGIRTWVREIITVLLLAGLVEMLLPQTETKRFARVVIGFFVILAVARPVFGLLGGGASLGLELTRFVPRVDSPPAVGNEFTGDDPLLRGAQLREASRERALAASRTALETQIAALAEGDEEVERAEAGVALASDPSLPDYGALRLVNLTVWMVRGEGGVDGSVSGQIQDGEGARGPITVRIDPIITTRQTEESGQGGAASAGVIEDSRSRAAAALAARLRSRLVLVLGIPPDGLRVEVWP